MALTWVGLCDNNMRIIPYHGPLPDSKLRDKLDQIAIKNSDNTWEYNKDLETFAKEWERHFLYYPSEPNFPAVIYVTQYSHFGQR